MTYLGFLTLSALLVVGCYGICSGSVSGPCLFEPEGAPCGNGAGKCVQGASGMLECCEEGCVGARNLGPCITEQIGDSCMLGEGTCVGGSGLMTCCANCLDNLGPCILGKVGEACANGAGKCVYDRDGITCCSNGSRGSCNK